MKRALEIQEDNNLNGTPLRVGSSVRPVRMRDVAALAGVGTMTVSRVLNGTVRVTEETSRRVYAAIEALHYKPNQLARALRGSRSHTIGLLLPYLYDPFFATCAHAIDTVAQQHGYSVLLTTINEDPAIELEAVRQITQRQVDGLIIIPTRMAGAELRREARESRSLPWIGPLALWRRIASTWRMRPRV